MKRIVALVCLIIMAVTVMAPATFAANSSDSQKAGFAVVDSTPHDGDDGVAVENLSVKIYFSKDVMPASQKIEKANAKEFKLKDENGKKIPVKVYYSDEEEGLMMVASDISKDRTAVQGDTNYTLTIGKDFKAADGTKLGATETIAFKTLDQGKSTLVYTIMMIAMVVGMVYFTSKSAKKATEKENQEKGKSDTVNPYKEAKRTGKSVEEIVEKDQKKKAKEAEALAKKRAKEAELMAALEDDDDEEASSNTKRISAPKPISATGSTYKVKVVKTKKAPEKKGTTNPKGQSGKQKNSKKKGKK